MAREHWGKIAIVAGMLGVAASSASADDKQTVKDLADSYAQAAIDDGKAVGVAVGVAYKGQVFYTTAFGLADAKSKTPFTTDTLFEIASNTKVFTTNLLGQAVFNKKLALSDPLSRFSASLGALPPETEKVTLEELADFTAGYPSYAPLCKKERVPGCRPSARPTTTEYGAKAFLEYFQHTKPISPSLPAPYEYSDFSIGLLGLLMPAAAAKKPLDDVSLLAWAAQVTNEILTPLGMNRTYLTPPASITPASGYSLALASAWVEKGEISKIDVVKHGGSYAAAPEVTIAGGGGSGASARAEIGDGGVASIKLTKGGSGYIAPPDVRFEGGSPSKPAKAVAIVPHIHDRWEVAAIDVISGGSSYQSAPSVMISGGRKGGRDAMATAHIADGDVVAVVVKDGGAGYIEPLSVRLAPGGAESNVVPIWAPAGALLSTVNDMTRFAAAAAGVGTVQSRTVPKALAEGFKIAEKAYACQSRDPKLAECAPGQTRSALAWSIRPADSANAMPEVVTKTGGLGGFSSQIVLVPSRQLAVVVMVNSSTEEPAVGLALNIAHNLVFQLP